MAGNRYSAGFSVAGVNTANTRVINLNGAGTAGRVFVYEIAVGIAVAPTTAPSFYLARSTARGTQTTTLAGQPYDEGDVASSSSLDSAWSVAPTFSTSAFIRRGGLAVTAGGWWIWQFYDSPLIIPATAGAGITLANANASGATTGTFAGHVVWNE